MTPETRPYFPAGFFFPVVLRHLGLEVIVQLEDLRHDRLHFDVGVFRAVMELLVEADVAVNALFSAAEGHHRKAVHLMVRVQVEQIQNGQNVAHINIAVVIFHKVYAVIERLRGDDVFDQGKIVPKVCDGFILDLGGGVSRGCQVLEDPLDAGQNLQLDILLPVVQFLAVVQNHSQGVSAVHIAVVFGI